jgi:HK97 family phage major capsid protein
MKSVKALTEERESLAIEAKAIFEAAQKGNRDLTEEEAKRFDEITKVEIKSKEKELAQAKEREEAMLAISVREQRKTSLQEIGDILNPQASQPRVLPVNGRLPENADAQPQVFHRMSKLKAFKDERTAYDCGMWIRAMLAKAYNRDDKQAAAHVHRLGWQVTNVGIEGTGSLGGYTVPSPLAQTIIDVRETVGVARRILKIMPMTSDTLSIARRDGGLTVYYVGEAQAITLSDKTWGQVELIAKKRAVAHQISQELQDDALISIVDDAMNEMAYALATKEDAETINGDGTATYGGVVGLIPAIGSAGVSQAATGHDTWPELDIADFTAAMGKLPDKYSRNPVWVTSANFYWSTMARIGATASGNNLMNIMQGPEGQPMFLGRPVYFTDQMPKTTGVATIAALFGSFDMGAILGERTGITLARSDEYAFLNDVTTIKATTRYDINVHAPGDATNAGAYVALKTAA